MVELNKWESRSGEGCENRSDKGKISLVIHIVTHIDPKDENNIQDTKSLHISESLHFCNTSKPHSSRFQLFFSQTHRVVFALWLTKQRANYLLIL